MNFIPLINVLNISIILIMIIAFAKAANSKKNNVILFQLVDHETDKDYNAYVDKQLNKNEKKLNLYEYHRTVYNVKAVRVPSSSVKSFEMYKNDFYDYCENTYKDPEMASQEYNLKVLEDTLNFFFTCLIPERLNEIKDILLDEKNEIGYKSVISTVLLKSKTTQTREEIIRQISKKLNDVTREKLLYTCILQFKNGVTEMNTTIGLYTEEYISSIRKDKFHTTKISDDDIKFLKRKEISMDIKSVELSTALKRQILEDEELEFLKHLASLAEKNQFLNLVNEARHFYQRKYRHTCILNDFIYL
ncbi:uncharacterized protein LOC132918031 [Rhopalosiphum padi]|uniref:uncharacterized protein LOC132918031 n=1 Tax=Rhopalosiphum padi TaxID=40932 RepID=UPI00298E1179|nr:uncharacterized protein LOC132918031 [Rhopalosiphum padi]